MALTNAGRNFIAQAIINDSTPLFYDNTNAKIGVGESVTAFNVSQTDLQGASRIRKGMEATYPSLATNVITFRSIFSTAQANFAWNEWGVFNHITNGSGTMLNRVVESLGTKTSAQSWQITVDITVSIGT